ncbi:MAG: HAMP domain-containing histidine kinase [Oligoflexia bacterium]|nr:HAMP domain-containing histidine kinase [Oligoflexia bacterium]
MKKEHTMHLGKRFLYLWPAVIVCLYLVVAVFFRQFSMNMEKIFVLQEGVNTCFYRVTQSFLSAVLPGDFSKAYLKENFLNTTQECFGEIISELEEVNATDQYGILTKVNKLSGEIFAFQHALGSSVPVVNRADFYHKYENIENMKFVLLEKFESWKKREERFELWGKRIFMLMGLVISIAFIAFYWAKRRNIADNRAINLEASAELEKRDGVCPSSSRVEEVVKKALEQNGLYDCSQLFSKYNDYLLDNAFLLSKSNLPASATVEGPTASAAAEAAGTALTLGAVDLSKVINSTINLLSNKIFVNGIYLKVNHDENIWVLGDDKILSSIFYNLIDEGIKFFSGKNFEKKILISIKTIQDRVVVEFADNADNAGSGVDLLATGVSGISTAAELIRQLSGKIVFEDHFVIDQSDSLGERARFSLFLQKSAPKSINETTSLSSSSRLVDLKVGKKKNLAREFNESV